MSNNGQGNADLHLRKIEHTDFSTLNGVQDKNRFISNLHDVLDANIDPDTIALSIKRGLLRFGTHLSEDTATLVQHAFQGKCDELINIINAYSENVAKNNLGELEQEMSKHFKISVEEGRRLFLDATETDVHPDSKRVKGVLSTQFDKAKLAFYAHANGGVNALIGGNAADYLPKQQGTEEKSSIDLG